MKACFFSFVLITGVLNFSNNWVAAQDVEKGFLFRSGFEKRLPDQLAFEGGQWQVNNGQLSQSEPGGIVLAITGQPDWNNYRVSAKVKFDSDPPYAEAGIVYAFRDSGNHHLFCLSHRKAGWYVMQRTFRHGPKTSVDLVGDMAMVDIDPTQWHLLQVDFSDGHAVCFLDGKHVTDFTFEGAPPSSYLEGPHGHGRIWPDDFKAGKVGLFTQRVGASFDDLQVTRLTSTQHLITPRRPRYGADGLLLPRMSYSKIIEGNINWTLRQKDIVDVAAAIDQRGSNLPSNILDEIKQWDVYLLTSHLTPDDRGLTDIQYPAHNHPYMIIALIKSYAYSGEKGLLDRARELADWNLKFCYPKTTATPYLALSAFTFQTQKEESANGNVEEVFV